MIYKKSPPATTAMTKIDVMNSLKGLIADLKTGDAFQRRKIGKMFRHLHLAEDFLFILVRRLVFKKEYTELFQLIIDLLFEMCRNDPNFQRQLLPQVNRFADLLNRNVETGGLIREVFKSNHFYEYEQSFIKYVIQLIIADGNFRSSLFYLLKTFIVKENLDEESQQLENPNQSFVFRQLVGDTRFKNLIQMTRSK